MSKNVGMLIRCPACADKGTLRFKKLSAIGRCFVNWTCGACESLFDVCLTPRKENRAQVNVEIAANELSHEGREAIRKRKQNEK